MSPLSKGRYVTRMIEWKGLKMANICDEELLGKVIDNEGHKMYISKEYFNGPLVGLDEALELVRSCPMVSLVGDRIVGHVLKNGLACPEAVKKVGSTSFLMIFKFRR